MKAEELFKILNDKDYDTVTIDELKKIESTLINELDIIQDCIRWKEVSDEITQ